MDVKRAEEIVNSKGVIEVTYEGSPVWIENVIKDDSTAQVKVLSNNKIMNLPLEDLTEKDSHSI